MPINLRDATSAVRLKDRIPRPAYLRLDQHKIDEQDYEVMFDVFVAEAAAILAHRQPDVVAA
jgi:primosomal protein N''